MNLNPKVRLSEHLAEKHIKALLNYVDLKTGSAYACERIVSDFIDNTVREFRMLRHCVSGNPNEDKQEKIDSAIRQWCMDFGLENPKITW